MAKAVRPAPARSTPARSTPSKAAPPRPRGPLPTPRSERQSLVAYFRGVWDELRKVVWPARDELGRMTGIVIATVILFGILIGGADYLLSLGVKQVYTSTGQSSAAPTLGPQPSAPSGQPPHATPLP